MRPSASSAAFRISTVRPITRNATTGSNSASRIGVRRRLRVIREGSKEGSICRFRRVPEEESYQARRGWLTRRDTPTVQVILERKKVSDGKYVSTRGSSKG